MSQAMWDERYANTDRVWSGAPNAWLVEFAEPLQSGTALDLGCGEGADAIWLAQRGWDVTAVDFSLVGLAKAEARAVDAGVSVSWLRQDLAEWAPTDRYDLVTVQFFHGDPEVRRDVHRLAWQATAGTLLVVGHALGHPGPPPAEVRYDVDDICAAIDDDAAIRVAEVRTRGAAVDAVVVATRPAGQSQDDV